MNGQSSSLPEIIIEYYMKEDCHLCEKMDSELADFIQTASDEIIVTVKKRDIEEKREWFDKYREYVPVLVIDQQEINHYFFDENTIRLAVDRYLEENIGHA